MTLQEIKDEILSRTARLEMCDAFFGVRIATSRTEILEAGKDMIEWAYLSGVVDDILLAEFTTGELNAYGIYNAGENLTNPAHDIIYYMGTGTPAFTLTGNNQCKISFMGTVSPTCVLEDNAYVEIKFYGSTASVTMNDKSTAKMQASEEAVLTVVSNDDSVLHLNTSDDSITDYTGNNNSFLLAKVFNRSQFTYALNGSAQANIKALNQGVINSPMS